MSFYARLPSEQALQSQVPSLTPRRTCLDLCLYPAEG